MIYIPFETRSSLRIHFAGNSSTRDLLRNMASVEAAALSTVISRILKIVGSKLAPLVIKRYTSIVGVTKDVKDLQLLVEEINSWLERAEYQVMGDDASLNWLKQLKGDLFCFISLCWLSFAGIR